MSHGLKITIKGGERIYVNGAVLKMDRKVGVELLNEATFLLEQHILQPEEATTPLRQLYFMVQMMLIDPSLYAKARDMARETTGSLLSTLSEPKINSGLEDAIRLVNADRPLEALKKIRALYPLEAAYLQPALKSGETEKEVA
jgi:flagellar biosynthesis repressor protein FlbT